MGYLTRQLKVADPLAPLPSLAVTVTEAAVRPLVGVPEMTPVELLILRPVGSPVAEKVKAAPVWLSEAAIGNGAIATLCVEIWLPGEVTVTVLATFQVKLVVPLTPAVASVTVIVTDVVCALVPVVPVISPAALSDSPLGRPEAVYVKGYPVPSWATIWSPVIVVLSGEDWLPGEVTVIVVGPVMVQLNGAAPVAEVASVTVTVTEFVPTAVGVPVIDPVLALMLRPAGKPVAE